MAGRSLRFHFCISSSILSILAGFNAHKQPLRDELLVLFSTFSKHLFKERLCLTEFFHPSGAVCKQRGRAASSYLRASSILALFDNIQSTVPWNKESVPS